MRKIGILISIIVILLMFRGCGSETTYWQNWEAPNWTGDGKIVFLEDDGEQRINSWGDMVGGNQTLTLYEIDEDGNNLQQIGEIVSCSFESGRVLVPMSTSSAGNRVVLSIEDWRRGEHYPVMYTIKRNGDSLSEIGSGRYPDFSPDASQIVYEKSNQGIWIMDRDAGNDRQIISDTDARYPAWSPDGGRIAYVIGYPNVDTLLVIDTLGILLNNFFVEIDMPDWGPLDSNAVSGSGGGYARIVYYDSGNINNSSNVPAGWGGAKWSPLGAHFIGWASGRYWITDRNSGNTWSLEP